MISSDTALRVLRNPKLFLTITPERSGKKRLAWNMKRLLFIQSSHSIRNSPFYA